MTKSAKYRILRLRFHSGVFAAIALIFVALCPSASAVDRSFKFFRYSPTAYRGPNNSVQLSEVTFRRAGAAVSVAGVIVTNPGGNTPANENPPKLVDGNTGTKWLDFNKAPVIFEFPAITTIDGYNFATANDATERDPISWTFEGSANGTTWTLLDSVTNFATPLARQTFAATNSTTGFPLNSVVVSSFSANKAIVLNSTPVILDWQTFLATSVSIDQGIGTVSANGPLTVTAPASTTTTYTLTAVNGAESSSKSTIVRSVVGGSSNFQFVRFSPKRLRSGTAPGVIQLSELRFKDNGTTLTPVSATNPGGANADNAAEGASKLIDGLTTTKWLNNNTAPLIFNFGAPVNFDSYYLSTGNDASERDPVRWIIEGSNDQTAWTLIDNVTAFDYNTPIGRQIQSLDIPLPGPSLIPVINLFVGDAPKLIAGQPLVLTYNTAGGTASIDQGVGAVSGSGSVTVNPTVNTTYTLSATGGGTTVTASFSVIIITPGNTIINYPNFNAAFDEVALLGDATYANDPGIPLPSADDRLRVTPNAGSKSGFVWFRKRQNFSAGFQSFFDFQFTTSGNPGADGMAFVIQNTPQGSGLTFDVAENGSPVNSLNVSFDSFDNDGAGTGEPSDAYIRVRAGTTTLATVDLKTFTGLLIPDLTQASNAPPFAVQVDYVPGDLDIYVNNLLVVNSLNVNLGVIGAVNAAGKGYVGFAARTGGFFESHDVTRWIVTEGIPPVAPASIKLLSHSFNFAAQQLTLTWSSVGTRTYRITTSPDLISWSNVMVNIQGAPNMTQTTRTISFTQGTKAFFRVEEP